MPYWFTRTQIELLIRVIGNDIENGGLTLRSVNDEIGISKARKYTSSIRAKLPMIFRDDKFVLMLSSEECNALMMMNLPADIREVIADGL
jgi:hypothetical protein